MLLVLYRVTGENQDVIQVHEHKPVEHVPKDIINQSLENCRGICESEGHHQIFEVSKGGVERRLPLISLLDADEVISISQVELGE